MESKGGLQELTKIAGFGELALKANLPATAETSAIAATDWQRAVAATATQDKAFELAAANALKKDGFVFRDTQVEFKDRLGIKEYRVADGDVIDPKQVDSWLEQKHTKDWSSSWYNPESSGYKFAKEVKGQDPVQEILDQMKSYQATQLYIGVLYYERIGA